MSISLHITPSIFFFVYFIVLLPILWSLWFFLLKPFTHLFFTRYQRILNRRLQTSQNQNTVSHLENEYTEKFIAATDQLDSEHKNFLLKLNQSINQKKEKWLGQQKQQQIDFICQLKADLTQKKERVLKLIDSHIPKSLIALCIGLGYISQVWASDGPSLGWSFFQFFIFLGILIYWGRQPIYKILSKHTHTIQNELHETREELEKSKNELNLVQQKLQNLPDLIGSLRTQQDIKHKKMLQDLEFHLKQMEEEYRLNIEIQKKRLEVDLTEEYDTEIREILFQTIKERTNTELFRKQFHAEALETLIKTPPHLHENLYV